MRRPPTPAALPLRDLARLRQGAYRFLGTLFLAPDGDMGVTLPALAAGFRDAGRALAGLAFWGPWMRLLAALEGPGAVARLATEHARRFAPGPAPSPACESTHAPPGEIARIMAELEREYAAMGFAVKRSCAEPPDHAAVEVEFLGLLCEKEAEAWKREDTGAALQLLEREAGFLARHPGRWFRELARAVRRQDGGDLFPLVTEAGWAFIAHDRELVAGLIDGVRRGQGDARRPV
jgi:TorA maturation chaperone TorD